MAIKKVLIIDDDPEILDLLEVYLRAEKIEVIKLEEGIHGHEIAKEIKPDLIILDVMLPEIDGLKLCRLIKNDKETRHIPVLLITALDGNDTKIEAIGSAADDFIPKPFERKEVMNKINALLSRKEEK